MRITFHRFKLQLLRFQKFQLDEDSLAQASRPPELWAPVEKHRGLESLGCWLHRLSLFEEVSPRISRGGFRGSFWSWWTWNMNEYAWIWWNPRYSKVDDASISDPMGIISNSQVKRCETWSWQKLSPSRYTNTLNACVCRFMSMAIGGCRAKTLGGQKWWGCPLACDGMSCSCFGSCVFHVFSAGQIHWPVGMLGDLVAKLKHQLFWRVASEVGTAQRQSDQGHISEGPGWTVVLVRLVRAASARLLGMFWSNLPEPKNCQAANLQDSYKLCEKRWGSRLALWWSGCQFRVVWRRWPIEHLNEGPSCHDKHKEHLTFQCCDAGHCQSCSIAMRSMPSIFYFLSFISPI